jgi:cystathionine beta-lyase/cystathionine gamma-synthase
MWAGTVDEGALTEAGISQGLIRVAAGLEDTDDLVDLEHQLHELRQVRAVS